MTKPTKRATAATVWSLNEAIRDAVIAESQVANLNKLLVILRRRIKQTLAELGQDRHATPEGDQALLVEKLNYDWDLELLAGSLSRGKFAELCPRKPDGAKLRAMLESLPDDVAKRLRDCATVSHIHALELRRRPCPAQKETP